MRLKNNAQIKTDAESVYSDDRNVTIFVILLIISQKFIVGNFNKITVCFDVGKNGRNQCSYSPAELSLFHYPVVFHPERYKNGLKLYYLSSDGVSKGL